MAAPQILEAILFYKSEPISIKKLSELTGRTVEATIDSLHELEQSLVGRGIVLLRNNDEVMLGTSKEASSIIEKLVKEELHRDLGKAGLETLAIILYLGPIARSEIDYIRGVNSNFILRNLLIRGLIERVENPNDKRSFLYRGTFELLSYMGVSKLEDLPEYETLRAEINAKKEARDEAEKESQTEDSPPEEPGVHHVKITKEE